MARVRNAGQEIAFMCRVRAIPTNGHAAATRMTSCLGNLSRFHFCRIDVHVIKELELHATSHFIAA